MTNMEQILTVADFDAALKEPYAWPGGYPRYFVTKDGAALSFESATEEADSIRDSITHDTNDGWLVVAVTVNWEDDSLYCDHSGDRIESAYAEPEEWSGSPDPTDPDNYWIDDKTGERVNANTGERTRGA